jgi:hypothetical protein
MKAAAIATTIKATIGRPRCMAVRNMAAIAPSQPGVLVQTPVAGFWRLANQR